MSIIFIGMKVSFACSHFLRSFSSMLPTQQTQTPRPSEIIRKYFQKWWIGLKLIPSDQSIWKSTKNSTHACVNSYLSTLKCICVFSSAPTVFHGPAHSGDMQRTLCCILEFLVMFDFVWLKYWNCRFFSFIIFYKFTDVILMFRPIHVAFKKSNKQTNTRKTVQFTSFRLIFL